MYIDSIQTLPRGRSSEQFGSGGLHCESVFTSVHGLLTFVRAVVVRKVDCRLATCKRIDIIPIPARIPADFIPVPTHDPSPSSWNFAEIFGIRKLEFLDYRMALLFCDSRFSHLCRTPTCDGRTDGRTDGHTMTVYTALTQRRAVNNLHSCGRPATFPVPTFSSQRDLLSRGFREIYVISFLRAGFYCCCR